MTHRVLNKRTGIAHDVPDNHWSLQHEDYEVVGANMAPTTLVIEPEATREPDDIVHEWMAPLPEAFPHYAKLKAAGYETLVDLRAATDDELLALKGVGSSALRAIRKALMEA